MGLYSIPRNESADFDHLLESYVPEETSLQHMMEFVVTLDENDQQLFDSLIECDFMTAANNAVMNEADAAEVNKQSNEVKKNKIMEKIKEVLAKLKDMILKLTQNIIAKVMELVKGDEKLVKAYKNVITIDNLKDWDGIADFAFPKENTGKTELEKFDKAAKEFADVCGSNSSTKNDITDAVNNFGAKKEDIIKSLNQYNENVFEKKVDKWKPENDRQINVICFQVSNASNTIKEIKTCTKSVIERVQRLEAYAKAVLKSKKDDSDFEVYVANEMSKVVSGSSTILAQVFTAYTNATKKRIAAYRKAFILCGRAAMKASNANAKQTGTAVAVVNQTHESAESQWIIGEASNDYVFECLAY